MSYRIEWLDAAFTRAVVTHRRWFKPDRVTEVQLHQIREVWYHANSTIPVDAGLQSRLFREHIRQIALLCQRERDESWTERRPLPRARASRRGLTIGDQV